MCQERVPHPGKLDLEAFEEFLKGIRRNPGAAPTVLGFRVMFLAMAGIISLAFLLALLKTEESLHG